MAEQAQKPQQPPQQAKPSPVPEPGKKRQVTLDQILDGLSGVPLILDEDNDSITLKTRDFALIMVGILEISDLNLFRAVLRRRRDSGRFGDGIAVDSQTQ